MSRKNQRKKKTEAGHSGSPVEPRAKTVLLRRKTAWLVTGVVCALIGASLFWLFQADNPQNDVARHISPADAHDVNSAQQPNPLVDDSHAAGVAMNDLEQLAFAPSRNGWETENNSDAITAQLKKIGKITSHNPINNDDVAEITAKEFHCSSLRPTGLQDVTRDASLLVRRLPTDVPSGDPNVFSGADGLAAALRSLRAPFDPNSELRPEIKVFRISIDGSLIETNAYVKWIGPAPEGILQQTATWKCQWKKTTLDELPRLLQIDVESYEETISRSGAPLFTDCTVSVLGKNRSFQEQLLRGLVYWGTRIPMKLGMLDPTGKHGICVGDVNGDALEDLYVLQPAGLPNGLYVQNADGTATNQSADSGVDLLDPSTSALLVDLDNDGDQDLIVGTTPGLVFFENDGNGKFTPRATKPTPMGVPYSLAAADYDADRDLDIYVCCYTPLIRDEPQLLGKPIPYHDANNGAISILLRQEKGWRFRNVTKQVGLDVNNRRFSYAAAWEDYDNDGDQDLYVANDFGRNNLYRNDDGKFVDVAAAAGVEDISAGMSVSWADYDQDGHIDLYVSNMFSSAGNRIAYQRKFNSLATGKTRTEFQRHARGNSLFRNTGDGTFEDVSVDAGVTMGRWAWSSHFVDLNNDGWEDIVVANGFLTNDDARDL